MYHARPAIRKIFIEILWGLYLLPKLIGYRCDGRIPALNPEFWTSCPHQGVVKVWGLHLLTAAVNHVYTVRSEYDTPYGNKSQ